MTPKAVVSSFAASLDQIARLVAYFTTNRHVYLAGDYKEAQVRQNLIDPLFIALGWDVHNDERVAPQYCPVVVEPSQDIEGQKKAPDYAFRIGPQTRFYAEAKKVGVSVKNDPAPAYQLRRYAWSAKLPMSLLTDFEELSVYDCRFRPSDKDKASVARVKYFTFEQYPDCWQEIWDWFSYDSVLHGRFDQLVQSAGGKRGTSEVDGEFLNEIEQWRNDLARNIALRNPGIGIDELNDAVQRTIDRIIFLRMAEDRGVEPYERLHKIAQGDDIYPGLIDLFRKADAKYNSGLFDLSTREARQTSRLVVDDKVLKSILTRLYYPESPYEFSVLPIRILGNIYEQFLGKVIRLTAGHQARVEEKPEVKKAGGVKYTPEFIADHIVHDTVGKLVVGKSPRQLATWLRVLDMACGSGSFLLAVYQFLLDYYLLWYMEHEPQQHPQAVWRQGDTWRLTIAEKKRILTTHIFGVDIDRQAVEVTKLSLLMKVLEGESDETIGQLSLFQERALPNLDKNIKCGNSLIGPDYFSGRLVLDPEEMRRINPFDWEQEFPEVMNMGGFSCIVGNPPYIRIQLMKEWAPLEVEIYKELYATARTGNYDIYVVFVEKALSLLNKQGRLGFILPHKFFNAKYGEPLRRLISAGKHLSQVVHFGDQQVFAGVSTYTCLLFLDKAGCDECQFVKVDDLVQWRISGFATNSTILNSDIHASGWSFARNMNGDIFSKLTNAVPLQQYSHVFQGLATSADSVYVLELLKSGRTISRVRSRELDGEEFEIETSILHPLLKGSEITRYNEPVYQNVILFPYEITNGIASVLIEHELRNRFPLAYSYFVKNKVRLLNRSKVDSRTYWHFPYPKNLASYTQPKILVQVLSSQGAFTLDLEGKFYFVGGGNAGGNAVYLESGNKADYLYLLGILNSKLTTYHVRRVGSRFRGGYYSFGKSSIGTLPVRKIDFNDPTDKARHDRMVTLVGQMLELHKHRQAAESDHERELYQRQIDATDQQIDALVYELYGLTEDEIGIVEGTGV